MAAADVGPAPAPLSVVIAGGHSAGHIEPAMNVADAIRRLRPETLITAVGTVRGLDTTLIPARGYPLELIPAVPLPRKPNLALLQTPLRLIQAVAAAGSVLDRVRAQVVVGFGGYVAVPVYLAARKRGIPIVVHEANAQPGIANRLGALLSSEVFTATSSTSLAHATPIGMPLRPEISGLDRSKARAGARARLGLDLDRLTVLVTGGSQGAQRINQAVLGAQAAFCRAGIQVLHIVGPANPGEQPDRLNAEPRYLVFPYLAEMADAYAAADFVLCRCGAMTCAELSAVGLPAAYVPLPLRGGEQARNAIAAVSDGSALMVPDAECTSQWVAEVLISTVTDERRLAAMTAAALKSGRSDAADRLARRILAVAGADDGDSAPAALRSQASFDRPAGWAAPGAALVTSAAIAELPDFADLGRVHIMGIAGAGMSGLARLMLARGLQVSGCEGRDSVTVKALRAQGAEIFIGHSVDHLDDVDTLVYTTAIDSSHFELAAGRDRGLQVLRRASALAAMIAGSRPVAIAGTHGKTTTTSLLTVAAQAGGLDPSFAIGGNLYESGLNAHAGTGDVFIVEADESDGSFLLLRPEIAVITNVEADHLENHGDLEGIFRAFELFVDRIVGGGLLVICQDDAGARRIADYARTKGVRVRTYGSAEDADFHTGDILEQPDGIEFTVTATGRSHRLRVGALVGRHMALNATAALAVAIELGVDVGVLSNTWASFQGVRRRFEFRGEALGVRVYDDYAHHPTEVRAELTAARSVISGGGRLIAVFQPGTYSRTQTFAVEFGAALAVADIAVVMDVFPAREEPIPGVTGDLIARAVPLPASQVFYEPSWQAMAPRVGALTRPGDVVVTMGIGDIHLACPEILREVLSRPTGGQSS